MVDALKNGDRERLTALIRAHLKSYFKSYKAQNKENC
jgi:DNA-binding GntR family transcriptional regulator